MTDVPPLRLIAALVLFAGLAACGRGGDRARAGAGDESAFADDQDGDCAEPDEGCACDGNEPPVACRPSGLDPQLNGGGERLCFEGTRYCRNGSWSGCEDVHTYSVPARPAGTALVDQLSDHPQCSDCEPECHRVVDGFNPDDGDLDGGIAGGIVYHGSGAGITLEAHDAGAMPETIDGGVPSGTVFIGVDEGLTGKGSAQDTEYPSAADVYLLLDMSSSMSEEVQWLYDESQTGSGFLPSTLTCADGDATALSAGMTGALSCMIDDLRVGAGIFRDIPFAPYSEDQNASDPGRTIDAKHEIPYRHSFDFTSNMSMASGQLSTLGAIESSGDPDFAGSQIPALYSVATGTGMFTGIDRRSVPAGPSCGSGAGYPCFRSSTDRIVVLASDAPMHNGPTPATLPYDYDPAQLDMSLPTAPGIVSIPATNDDWSSAYALSSDVAPELRMYSGSSAGLGAQIGGAVVGCGANDAGPDAMFSFGVNAGGSGTVPVLVSAEGSGFQAALALFDHVPGLAREVLTPSTPPDQFPIAYDVGDLVGREVSIDGDINPMQNDYQGSMYGASCGAGYSGDAVYQLNVDSASGPREVEASVTMGTYHPMVAIYQQGVGSLPQWPGVSGGALTAAGNSDASPGKVYDIPFGPAQRYLTIDGSTVGLGADYDSASVGATACSPDSAALDAAFKIHVDGRRTLRFDTEGSTFNTVLSLHSQPPLAATAVAARFAASTTHNNTNESGATAYATGAVNGKNQIFEGNTAGMAANVTDTFSCGLDDACADAVYKISVTTATTLRLSATGTGFDPGVVLTRAAPEGVSGEPGVVATGGAHSCAVSGGHVYCWGRDDSGQLGNDGASGDADSPSPVEATGLTNAAQVCAGASHSCAVLRDGQVACWGNGGSGQLGTGDTNDAFAPALLAELGPAPATLGPAVQVACGDAFSCALLADGRVVCFGDNSHGQLGDGTTTEHDSPTLINSALRFEQITAGSRHACAVRASDGALFCWGEGSHGKLGDSDTSDNLVPGRVGTLGGVIAVAAGEEHSCAVLSSGRAWCWGSNDGGQLGIGGSDGTDHPDPLAVQNSEDAGPFVDAVSVTAGTAHSCLLTLTGLVQCFGDDSLHQLGDGGTSPTSLPASVSDIEEVTRVFGGYAHGCALQRSGALACWGDNAHGQLGSGNTSPSTVPVVAHPAATVPLAFGTGRLDAGVAHACSSIGAPPEAGCQLKLNGSHAYQFCNDQPRTWAGAAQSCDRVGMQLANIDTLGENAFLASGIDSAERAWFGLKRVSSPDWTAVNTPIDFENLSGDQIWHTIATTRCLFKIGTTCVSREDHIRGYFQPIAPSDLISSNPYWTTSSTWATQLNPSTTVGHDCATVSSSRNWETDDCSSTASYDGRGGHYAAPPFAGGAEHPYVCEERLRYTDVALEPGDYYVTVKGVNDGVTDNACTGPYELKLTDLGAGGGFIACDDNGVYESPQSALEETLNEGDYYLILKGKHAGDQGNYKLTVRDVNAVHPTELTCDGGSGVSDPASVRFDAEPGSTYYAVVKSVGPAEEGPFTLTLRDVDADLGAIACDANSSPSGNPELTADLASGTYYAVLKGRTPTAAGAYQLTVGGAPPVSATFAPATYGATVDALKAAGIRVASVLSCAGRPNCADAQAQAAQLATDTNGVALSAATASDVPLQVVRAVEQLERAETVTGTLVFAPDVNPGFMPTAVSALDDASNRCAPGPSGPTFKDCLPGAKPTFVVSLHNPALAPVPFSSDPSGAYHFTLHVESKRGGAVVATRDVPVVVLPTGTPPPGTFSTGHYFQDIDGRGCLANQRPSWDVLRFKADVRPDTQINFYACTAAKEKDLRDCNGGSGASSGRQRTLTVTAGTGTGTPCTVPTQSSDCPDGYCSPYTHICNHLEGASCLVDVDCPGTNVGRCRSGPSAATLGRTCEILNLEGDPSSALDANNLQPFMRVEAELLSLGDGSRTPSLFSWEAWYRCRMVE